MRVWAILLVCLLATSTLAKKKHKKHPKDIEVDTENQLDDEGGLAEGGSPDDPNPHPCADKHCGEGKECDLDDDGKATCVCMRKCTPNTEERMKVCSTQNTTFDSDCVLLRQRCLCHHHHEGCEDPAYKHNRLDYYGACRELEVCTEEEMQEYPLRMRDWLYLVMEELSEREDLTEGEKRMAEEARSHTKRWVVPVIWKFCDLDITHDRLVDTKELVPLTAPLKALEHCTAPFLESCDTDNSRDISLEEWGTCLGLDPEDIEDKCDDIRGD